MDAWRELEDSERRTVWGRFSREFQFRPSTSSAHWPGIREPSTSVTYGIGHLFGRDDAESLENDLEEKALGAFRSLVSAGDWIWALDWQHPCYRFMPHAAGTSDSFPIPVFPNGDYYIFLEPDFKWGWFGHPWERTICLWGEPLIEWIRASPPKLFGKPVRSSTLPSHTHHELEKRNP